MFNIKNSSSKVFFYVIQAVGISFFSVFLVAYWVPLITAGFQKTAGTLINEPVFHWALAIVGGVFLLLCLVAVILSVIKPKTEA